MGPRAGLNGRKISPPPGFDLRIVHPVASRYTDYATEGRQGLLISKVGYIPGGDGAGLQ